MDCFLLSQLFSNIKETSERALYLETVSCVKVYVFWSLTQKGLKPSDSNSLKLFALDLGQGLKLVCSVENNYPKLY